ncbi:MAG TPA: flagellar basal body P-ring protein FlgI [Spirochaetia bacterium]|nr:flagellar basal body P-ring protein FlgI [Spirochaetia bacterium]
MRFPRITVILLLILIGFSAFAAPAVRIKDIAKLDGVRENQLLGIGLITGLAGKGDSSGSTLLKKTLSNLIANFGFQISPDEIKSKNCAVVMVSAEVPPFVRPGERIDLSVSSIGDARSLDGGILLQTNLKAANGQDYAMGQGKVLVSRAQGSVQTVGQIPGGGIVEREVLTEFVADNRLSIVLRDPDFVTASSVASAIRKAFEGINVNTLDASLIEVEVPEVRRQDVVAFIGELESLTVNPDVTGKVVIDSQSGVVIVGENVRIGKVVVSYESIEVSVGAPAWGAEKVPNLFVIEETANINDLVTALNAVGLDTKAIIGIMQAIERAGALFGRLVVL